MKRSLVTHLVVMIAAVLVGAHLAGILNGDRGKIATSQALLSKSPLGGCHKFAADVQWMLFINYCGSIDAINEENAPEVYRRLMAILKNDPDFEKAYEVGGLMLSVAAPKEAIEIFELGIQNPRLRQNWQIPFLAGYVMVHHMKGKDLDLVKAERFYREAATRSTPPEPHVLSSLNRVRAQALLLVGNNQGITLVNQKQAVLHALLTDWKTRQREANEGSFGGYYGEDLSGKILRAIQEAREESPEDENVRKSIELAKNTALKGTHLCEHCFATYGPGDKYCTACGSQVEVYGTCSGCGAVLKGRFCQQCSKDNQKLP